MFGKQFTYVSGRRRYGRMRAELPAALKTWRGTRELVICDLSPSGARLRSPVALKPGTRGVLHWMGQEAKGKVVWQDGEQFGIVFRKAVDQEVIDRTYERLAKSAS